MESDQTSSCKFIIDVKSFYSSFRGFLFSGIPGLKSSTVFQFFSLRRSALFLDFIRFFS